MKEWTSNLLEWHPPSIENWSIGLSGSQVQVCLGMLWCMYKRIRFLKWQSLLLKHHYHYCVHYKLSFLNISLKLSSLLDFAMKSPKIIYILHLWNSMNRFTNSSYKQCFEVSTFILRWGAQSLYITPATLSTNELCPFLLLIVHFVY